MKQFAGSAVNYGFFEGKDSLKMFPFAELVIITGDTVYNLEMKETVKIEPETIKLQVSLEAAMAISKTLDTVIERLLELEKIAPDDKN